MTTDVIGDLTFGDSFHMLESGRKNQYARDLQSVGISGGLRIELPLLTRLLAFVPLFQNARASNLRIDTYARQSLQRYANLLSEDASYSKPTLFSKLFRGEEAGALEPEDITFEAKVSARHEMHLSPRSNIQAGIYCCWGRHYRHYSDVPHLDTGAQP